jgi:hypothetical protein
MPKVMANGLYRRTLTLRVRITARIIRERERVKERASLHTEDGGSNDTWIVNQVRLKAQL